MLEFIKNNLKFILIVLIIIGAVLCLVLILWPASNKLPADITPADIVVTDPDLEADEQKVLLYALDFIYSYGNYSATEHRLKSLEGNVTPSFQQNVNALLAELEKPNSSKFSTLQPYAEDYEATFSTKNGQRIASVVIPGSLVTDSSAKRDVWVEQLLILQDNIWLLDSFQIK